MERPNWQPLESLRGGSSKTSTPGTSAKSRATTGTTSPSSRRLLAIYHQLGEARTTSSRREPNGRRERFRSHPPRLGRYFLHEDRGVQGRIHRDLHGGSNSLAE